MPFLRSQAVSPSTANSSTAPPKPTPPTKPSRPPTKRLRSKPAPQPTDPPPSPRLAASTPSTTQCATRPKPPHHTWTADDINVLIVLKLFGRTGSYRALADHWNVVCGTNVGGKAINAKWHALAGTAEGWRIGWWREAGRTDPVAMMILAQAGLDVQALCEGSDVEGEVGGGER